MSFVVNLDQINDWRSRQRARLEPYSLPIAESEKSLAVGRRTFSFVAGVFLLGLPVGLLFLLVPVVPRLGSGTLQIFAYIVFASISGAVWKVGFASLRETAGPASHEDALWKTAKKLALAGDVEGTVRCLAEPLTLPWQKRVMPRVSDFGSFAYDLLVKNGIKKADGMLTTKQWQELRGVAGVTEDLMDAFDDLRFVEMWLEASLNTGSGLSGVNPGALRLDMIAAASDVGRLGEFANLVRGMAESPDENRQFFEYLAGLLMQNAPLAAAVLSSEVRS